MFILQDKKKMVDITEFRILDGSSTYLGRKAIAKHTAYLLKHICFILIIKSQIFH
jgi:hypothetical protein